MTNQAVDHRSEALLTELQRSAPALAVLIEEAIAQLPRYFADTRWALDEARDPETGEAAFGLTIHADLADTAADVALARFDAEWWTHHVRRAAGRLCIDLGGPVEPAG